MHHQDKLRSLHFTYTTYIDILMHHQEAASHAPAPAAGARAPNHPRSATEAETMRALVLVTP